jgi:hypothetical protein
VAGTINSHDINSMVTALQEGGYQAKLDFDQDGDPRILTGADGDKLEIAFSSCKNKNDCDYVEILAFWEGVKPDKGTIAASKWNSTEEFSTALYSEKDQNMYVYHYLITGADGISSSSLEKTLDYFVGDFEKVGKLIQ